MRDHSARELILKLIRKYPKNEVLEAIKSAEELGYILDPQKLAQKVATQLDRRLRGIIYINQYLTKKGLPKVQADWDLELEKAMKAAYKKLKANPPYDLKQKQIVFRYLKTQGFDGTIARKVTYTK